MFLRTVSNIPIWVFVWCVSKHLLHPLVIWISIFNQMRTVPPVLWLNVVWFMFEHLLTPTLCTWRKEAEEKKAREEAIRRAAEEERRRRIEEGEDVPEGKIDRRMEEEIFMWAESRSVLGALVMTNVMMVEICRYETWIIMTWLENLEPNWEFCESRVRHRIVLLLWWNFHDSAEFL